MFNIMDPTLQTSTLKKIGKYIKTLKSYDHSNDVSSLERLQHIMKYLYSSIDEDDMISSTNKKVTMWITK